MAVTTQVESALRRTFLLDKTRRRGERFSLLRPEVVSSIAKLRESLARATKDSLWISYENNLTEALLRNLSWPARPLGSAVFVHGINPASLPALASCFHRFAFSTDGGFLPPGELAEALEAGHRADLFIGGNVDHASRTLTLWRGNLEPLTVPFAAFEQSGDGLKPDFNKFSVGDYGQTVKLGQYEAAADALLYEFDPAYRRRIARERPASEQTFGAALRRLRKQRGLNPKDFAPEVAADTITRIEQGQLKRIPNKTLQAIAKRLHVNPEEIKSY